MIHIGRTILRTIMGICALSAVASTAQAGGWHDGQFGARPKASNWDIEGRTARDINPRRDIVEINLVAKEKSVYLGDGVYTKMYTYNGVFPGPVIEGKVGDTLIVHFKNELPEETTVHWHGLEVPAEMDGSLISQNPVQPGEEFTYEFKLLRPSTYWYHPHIRGNKQVELGLQGMLIVHDPEDVWKRGLPLVEHNLVLDDILLDEDGNVADIPPTDDPLEVSNYLLNGREGNYLLVNGKIQPRAFIPRNGTQRFRLVNSSNTRFMRISIPDHEVYQIGTDGGLLEEPVAITPIEMVLDPDNPGEMMSDPDLSKGLILTPGERADLLVMGIHHAPVKIVWHDMERGRHDNKYGPDGATIMLSDSETDGKAPPQVMAVFKPLGPGARWDRGLPNYLTDIEPIDVAGARKVTIELGHTMPAADGSVKLFVQRKENTGQCPLPAGVPCPLPFPLVTPDDAPMGVPGETLILEVANLTGGQHNFHLHGFFFQHIETQFYDMDNPANNYIVPAERLENKDTIRLPARTGAMMRSKSVTRLAVKLDDTGREGKILAYGKTPGEGTSGGWLFHCHILEHSANGMMSFLQVVPEMEE